MARGNGYGFVQTMQTLRRVSRILWVRVALLSALSLVAAFSAEFLGPLIPDGPRDRFSQEATLPILTILANGMLAVVTFSLGVMVATHRTLAEQSTPRIHRLLMEDTSTQTMLATFIGAFVFSLSSIILYRADYYSDSASVIVFAATVFVVAAIVVSLMRWIHQLSQIGSVEYALIRGERTAREVLMRQKTLPRFGGQALEGPPPVKGLTPIPARRSGFLRLIEMDGLQAAAKAHDAEVYVARLPGGPVLEGEPLGHVSNTGDGDAFAGCFVIGTERTYEQDPAYAVQALRESASKALSPGINDPKTAVDIVARLQGVLWDWSRADPTPREPLYDRVFLGEVGPEDLIEAAFRDISRDGAAYVDVLAATAGALVRLREVMPATAQEVIDGMLADLRAFGEACLLTDRERDRLTEKLKGLGVA